MGFGDERVFLFSWKNNSFLGDDPQRDEKIALYCVGSTTASFEVGTAQSYFVVYKPRKNFAVIHLHFYLGKFRIHLFLFPFLMPQDCAITTDGHYYYANISLGYKPCYA